MCEAVRANGELMGLLQHNVGEGDAELMAAFDQVAKVRGKKRSAAIAKVRAMAGEGRLLTRNESERHGASTRTP